MSAAGRTAEVRTAREARHGDAAGSAMSSPRRRRFLGCSPAPSPLWACTAGTARAAGSGRREPPGRGAPGGRAGRPGAGGAAGCPGRRRSIDWVSGE